MADMGVEIQMRRLSHTSSSAVSDAEQKVIEKVHSIINATLRDMNLSGASLRPVQQAALNSNFISFPVDGVRDINTRDIQVALWDKVHYEAYFCSSLGLHGSQERRFVVPLMRDGIYPPVMSQSTSEKGRVGRMSKLKSMQRVAMTGTAALDDSMPPFGTFAWITEAFSRTFRFLLFWMFIMYIGFFVLQAPNKAEVTAQFFRPVMRYVVTPVIRVMVEIIQFCFDILSGKGGASGLSVEEEDHTPNVASATAGSKSVHVKVTAPPSGRQEAKRMRDVQEVSRNPEEIAKKLDGRQ